MGSRKKLFPDWWFRQENTKWFDGIVVIRLWAPLTSLKTHFQNQKCTLVHISSSPHFTVKGKNANGSLHKQSEHLNSLSFTSHLQQSCSLFPAKNMHNLPSVCIRLCSVTFTFWLLRLFKNCHWWVKQGESSYPGRHLENSRPYALQSDESQSCTATTWTNHNYNHTALRGWACLYIPAVILNLWDSLTLLHWKEG